MTTTVKITIYGGEEITIQNDVTGYITIKTKLSKAEITLTHEDTKKIKAALKKVLQT